MEPIMEVEDETKKRKSEADNDVVLEEVLKAHAEATNGLLKLLAIMGRKIVDLEKNKV